MATVIYVVALAATATLSASYILTDRNNNAIDDPNLNKWPDACAGKYYCWEKNGAYINKQEIFDDLLNNQTLDYRLGKEIGERSEVNDIGNCKPTPNPPITIYMIKDENDTIWYVPQSENFTISIAIEECGKLQGLKEYRITENDTTTMQSAELKIQNVQCVEQIVHFKFPVLKRSDNENGIILRSPYKGLSLSCSTKIVKKK